MAIFYVRLQQSASRMSRAHVALTDTVLVERIGIVHNSQRQEQSSQGLSTLKSEQC